MKNKRDNSFMKRELTLNELQQEGLKILKEVHTFCLENNIKYSVALSSALSSLLVYISHFMPKISQKDFTTAVNKPTP